jgi:hypothetical protein
LLLRRHPQILLGQVFDLTRTLPVGFVPIVGRTIARRCGELFKADGKLKMTEGDGLRIGQFEG